VWVDFAVRLEFLGSGRECYMRANIRIYNPGINTVRMDTLTFTSLNPTRTGEIDRFEYRPNPGSLLAPHSSQDVRLNGILLKANGNQSAWNYQWAANWGYTFWRPSVPGFPMSAMEVDQMGGIRVDSSKTVTGGDSGGSGTTSPASAGTNAASSYSPGAETPGDSVTFDRQSRSITIVIR